jgi:hypothetical protein
VKFSNGETTRKKLFKELQSYNDKLEKLLDSSDKETKLSQTRAATSTATAIDAAICTFWQQATRFFKALAMACNCHCQQHHFAKLLLQHRTRKQPDFQVLFTNAKSQPWIIRRTKISEGSDAISGIMKSVTVIQCSTLRQPLHKGKMPIKSAMKSKAQPAKVAFLE